MGIGKHIGEMLNEKGKSAAWLARETKIPATTIRTWISKDSDSISFRALAIIARALDCHLIDLVPETPIESGELDWWVSQKYQLLNALFTLSKISYDQDPNSNRFTAITANGKQIKLSYRDEDEIMDKVLNYFEFEINNLINNSDTHNEDQ